MFGLKRITADEYIAKSSRICVLLDHHEEHEVTDEDFVLLVNGARQVAQRAVDAMKYGCTKLLTNRDERRLLDMADKYNVDLWEGTP